MKGTTNSPERKLGRGLSALLGDSKSSPAADGTDHKSVQQVALKQITAGIYQPRKNFDNAAIEELADSIRKNGIIQPIILRKNDKDDRYEIIAGERRFRAAKVAGLATIAAIVKKIGNHEALEIALIENIQRADLSILEEAHGYQRLVDEFSYDQDRIAQQIGKSRSHVANMIRLLDLPVEVQNLLEEKVISMGHARAIINSKQPEELARRIVAEQLTVRDVEEIVRDEKVATKAKNTPAFVRNEAGVKFISREYLSELGQRASKATGYKVKISYNAIKKTGNLSIKFGDFDSLEKLMEKIEASKEDS